MCTDGAAATTGQDLGFTAFVKAGNDHITFTHCMFHREALVVKKIAPELNTVFFDAVKIINFIPLSEMARSTPIPISNQARVKAFLIPL